MTWRPIQYTIAILLYYNTLARDEGNVGFWNPQFIFTWIPLSLCCADLRTSFICIFPKKISRLHFKLSKMCSVHISTFLSITSTYNVTFTRTMSEALPPFCNVTHFCNVSNGAVVPTFQHWWHDMSMIRNFWAGKNNKGELKTLKPHNGAKFLFRQTTPMAGLKFVF